MAREALYHALAGYYDRIYGWKDYREEVASLLRIASGVLGRRPRSVLDVGCGTGRHLEEFRRTVPEIAGVDRSPAMLREARRRLGRGVPLVRADMRAFDLGRRFDLVVCLFSAIGYLPSRVDRDRALRTIVRHVEPGGAVLIEGWIRPAAYRGDSVSLLTYEGPEAKIARLTSIRRAGRFTPMTMHYLVGAPGRPIRHYVETHRPAMVEPKELLGSFRRAGLSAHVLLRGAYRDRGLYVGVLPARVPARSAPPRSTRGDGPRARIHAGARASRAG